jgi:phage baseplate assembly protein W
MSSLAVKLPLMYSQENGYMMIKSMLPMIQQNLKMLLLTDPGERVMIPTFGVGLRRYLFENFTETTYARIRQKINQQARTFMPYITINNIQFSPSDIDNGRLSIVINYVVPSLKSQDVLTFNV